MSSICSCDKCEGLCNDPDNNRYDSAPLLKLGVSDRRVQINQVTVNMTYSIPFSEYILLKARLCKWMTRKERLFDTKTFFTEAQLKFKVVCQVRGHVIKSTSRWEYFHWPVPWARLSPRQVTGHVFGNKGSWHDNGLIIHQVPSDLLTNGASTI